MNNVVVTDHEDAVEYYPSGTRASVFKVDGSGFINYPSGNVAICKGVVDERGRYYIYGDDPRSTPLGAVNEHAVGFFLGPGGVRLALSKVGGLITDKSGYIASEWRYDPGVHMPPPTGVLEVKLNKSITFEFVDRGEMRIHFSQNGIIHDLDAGVRPKREGTYLDNSVRLPGGRLEPQLDRVSLVSLQHRFGNAMKAKRDRLKPRSRNLAGACKSLVAGLEKSFDRMDPHVEPFTSPSWKSDALAATCRELPRIRSTGLEVGPTNGLGGTLYSDGDYGHIGGGGEKTGMRRSKSWGGGGGGIRGIRGAGGGIKGISKDGGDGDAFAAAAKLRKDGKWLGELDVRLQLHAENPLLKRSNLLQAASGRYAEEIVIPGGQVTVSNPTGKATVSGAPLHRVPASRLRVFLEEEAGPDQLVVVLGVRGDDRCGKVESAAELTNRFLLQRFSSAGGEEHGGNNKNGSNNNQATGASSRASSSSISSSSASAEKYRMVRVDFAEHSCTADFYGVKALPAFLMFQRGRLAWAGTLGGRPVKAAPPDSTAAGRRVLLVEPCAKAQITTERALRKFGCSWDLVLTAPQALLRIQMAKSNSMASEPGDVHAVGGGDDYGVLMISNAIGAAEVIALEKAFHGGGGYDGDAGSVIVGLADVQGDPYTVGGVALKVVAVGFTEKSDEKRQMLSPHLGLVADVVVTKPVRASAIEAVFHFCNRRRDGGAAGGGAGGVAAAGGKRGGGGSKADTKSIRTLSMSASCSTLEGGDKRYKGVTPSRLLEKMEEVGAQVAMGIFAADGAARGGRHHRPGGTPKGPKGTGEILVPAQETSCRGFMLERSTLQLMS